MSNQIFKLFDVGKCKQLIPLRSRNERKEILKYNIFILWQDVFSCRPREDKALSSLALTLTQIVKVIRERDAYITRVLGMGMPYYCDGGKGKDLGNRLVLAKEGRKGKTASPLTFPFHCSLRFVTSHSRFALASMRNRKNLRRRQVVDSYD